MHDVWFTNPDPTAWGGLFITVLVGPGNIASSPDSALLGVNQSFPQLTLPEEPGANLAPGATQSLTFEIQVSAAAEPTNYFSTDFLFQDHGFWPTTLLDRAFFAFLVT